MASCEKCGAFTDEKGKWAPAAHLSAVCAERDKAVKEAVELRWAIDAKNKAIEVAIALLTAGPNPPASSPWAVVVEVRNMLKTAL